MPSTVGLERDALGRRWSLQCLDAAVDYIRDHPGRVLPRYIVAMIPFSVAAFLAIDAVASQHRAAVPVAAMLLLVATLWRWAVLAAVQRRVQQDIRGEAPLPLRRRLIAICIARLWCNIAVTWLGILIVPGFYGFMAGGMIGPLLLEKDQPAWPAIRQLLNRIAWAGNRLTRISAALGVLTVIVLAAVAVIHLVLLNTVLPSLLGLDVADLWLTMQGTAWILTVGYGLFLLGDFYWTIASVFVLYDLEERQLGTDLRLRLRLLEENQP